MAKIRVPKIERPPKRFAPFYDEGPHKDCHGTFKVKGAYRSPKKGEYFWSPFGCGYVSSAMYDFDIFPGYGLVILERVK